MHNVFGIYLGIKYANILLLVIVDSTRWEERTTYLRQTNHKLVYRPLIQVDRGEPTPERYNVPRRASRTVLAWRAQSSASRRRPSCCETYAVERRSVPTNDSARPRETPSPHHSIFTTTANIPISTFAYQLNKIWSAYLHTAYQILKLRSKFHRWIGLKTPKF